MRSITPVRRGWRATCGRGPASSRLGPPRGKACPASSVPAPVPARRSASCCRCWTRSAAGLLTGVRAIVVYPLNALIESQRERLAAWTAPLMSSPSNAWHKWALLPTDEISNTEPVAPVVGNRMAYSVRRTERENCALYFRDGTLTARGRSLFGEPRCSRSLAMSD